ncbi:PucR family transcriptional regulator [Bifidobacterium pullorum subsp. saeculare]|uniref:PucR family transcriptional regulator n=1 Tax=Bifidobacterium pullorum subsp. saeculare TaxID=78257 RepID=A0A939B9I4_9BIFI|nr:PucR family transcriptional regulator [Bifidobacterium pullorum]MBM6698871.1 PucR family transcriptional regulator [Bifidobacterium pullorum subsp. saeculare]
MAMTVREAMEGPIFQTSSPEVVAGRSGLDRSVRWAYTHERYDVTRFLEGGELLIIEGSTLIDCSQPEELRRYVESLHQAGAAGLAVELVDYFRCIPQSMRDVADACGLPIIGLRQRVPFVELCREINTRIVHEQMARDQATNDQVAALRRRLSRAGTLADAASVVAKILDARVIVIAPDGRVVTHCDSEMDAGADSGNCDEVPFRPMHRRHGVTLSVACGGSGHASVIVIPRRGVPDDGVLSAVEEGMSRLVGLAMAPSVRDNFARRLLHSMPAHGDGTRGDASSIETTDLLRALGVLGEFRAVPFSLAPVDWDDGGDSFIFALAAVQALANPKPGDTVNRESGGGLTVLSAMNGDQLLGCLIDDDANTFATFPTWARQVLEDLYGAHFAVVRGIPAVDVAGLVSQIEAVRLTACRGATHTGIMSVGDQVYDRMLIDPSRDVADAVRYFIEITAAALRNADDVLIDTLCTLHSCAGNKTAACKLLGIQRQTLYNRLSRVEWVTGIGPEDPASWSAMLVGARLIRATRDAARSR